MILRQLMRDILEFEQLFEAEFTHYPRIFKTDVEDVSKVSLSMRFCHYFDKIYGTSTGG
jgi:hypothetical protein